MVRIHTRQKNLPPEQRVRRVPEVYLRQIYAAVIARDLTALGLSLDHQ